MKLADAIRIKEEVLLLTRHTYFKQEDLRSLCITFGRENTEYFLKVAEAVAPYSEETYKSAYAAMVEAGENEIIIMLPSTNCLLDTEWVIPYYKAAAEKDRLIFPPMTLEAYAIEKKRGTWQGAYDKWVYKNYLEALESYRELSKRFGELNGFIEKENNNG